MKKLIQNHQIIKPAVIISFLSFLSSCGVAPVNSSFEGARTLKKAKQNLLEITHPIPFPEMEKPLKPTKTMACE